MAKLASEVSSHGGSPFQDLVPPHAAIRNPSFFNRSADILAPELLGKKLIVANDSRIVEATILDVQAYPGGDDRDTQPYRGPRARAVTWEPGSIYVYASQGKPILTIAAPPYIDGACVLVRRALVTSSQVVVDGPANVARALGVSLEDCGTNLLTSAIMRIEDGERVESSQIRNGPRVNSKNELHLRWSISE